MMIFNEFNGCQRLSTAINGYQRLHFFVQYGYQRLHKFCKHGLKGKSILQRRCKVCKPSLKKKKEGVKVEKRLCMHKKLKYDCITCSPHKFCKHGLKGKSILQRRCTVCKPSLKKKKEVVKVEK